MECRRNLCLHFGIVLLSVKVGFHESSLILDSYFVLANVEEMLRVGHISRMQAKEEKRKKEKAAKQKKERDERKSKRKGNQQDKDEGPFPMHQEKNIRSKA